MAEVTATVEEIEGDVDTDHVNLVVPSSVVGAAADGDTVKAALIFITPALSFLAVGSAVVGADSVDLTVEEVEGDADTDSKWLVAPKTLISQPDGTELTGTVYDTVDGPVTVFPITS